MVWEIFIEGIRVDAPETTTAQLTFNIDDIRDFAARNTNFSKTIILPGSSTNKKVFGHIFDAGSSNFSNPANPNVNYDYNASKAANCIMFIDNIQVFKGVIRIMDIVVDGDTIEFETAVFGELGGLVASMGDNKLEHLDFSAYNHNFNTTSITDSWSAPLGSGYYYPMIDYGYSTDKVKFPIENFRPAFHVKEYIDKIFSTAGFTYDSVFFNSTYFKKQILPFNGQYMGELVTGDIFHNYSTVNQTYAGGGRHILDLTAIDPGGYLPYNTTTRRLIWARGETVRIKVTLSMSLVRLSDGNTALSALQVGLGEIGGSDQLFFDANVSAFNDTISGEVFIDLNPGKEYELFVYSDRAGTSVQVDNIDLSFTGTPDVLVPIGWDEAVEVNSCIPKGIFQIDLLRWLIKMFNLYIYEDKDRTNHLLVTPYIDFYKKTSADVEDWHYKLDRSKPFSYTPMGELNSRSYEYKYKDDTDYFNDLYKNKWQETYGSMNYDTGIEFVKEKNKVEIGFSPTPLVQYSNSSRVMSAIYKKVNDTDYQRMAHNPRIIFRSTAPVACENWFITYMNGSGLPAEWGITGVYPYAGHIDDVDVPTNDLNFGSPREFFFTLATGFLSANLFNVFWSFYISEISDKDSKLLKGYFKLRPFDIMNLDFSKPKFINGQLWRLNKIIDYSTGGVETTKCELLKVIDLV